MANEIDKIYDHVFIYMLTINEECYIGSTFNFNHRMNYHKNVCYNENGEKYNIKLYTYIRDHGGWNTVNIRIIDVYYLVTKKFKIETEQYYIDYFKSSLNQRSAFNGLGKKEYQKQYRVNNKETIKQKQKQYRENNKETIKQKQKEYFVNNKEKIYEYVKQYRENNIEKIKQIRKKYQKKRVNCPLCKKEMNRGSLLTHEKKYCKMNLK